MVPQFIQDIQPKRPMSPFPISPTEQKIQGLAQQQFQSPKMELQSFQQQKQDNTYDKTRFYDDVIKVKEREQISTEEAWRLVMSAYQQRGIEVVGLPYEQVLGQPIQQEPENLQGWILSSVWRGLDRNLELMDNTVWGALSNVPSIVWNTLWFLADVVTPKQFEWLWDTLREEWIRQRDDMRRALWVDPESFWASAWEFASELWTLFIPWGQATLISKFPKATQKIRTLAQWLDNLWRNAPKSYNAIKTLTQSALIGAFEMWKFWVVSEWEVTWEDLAVWAIANPVIGTTIKTIGKITRPLAEKLQVMGLLNPARLNVVSQQLKQEWVERMNVSQFLLKNNIKWNKESIIKQLNAIAKRSRTQVDDAIKTIPWKFKNESVDEMLSFLRRDLADVPGQKQAINKINQLFSQSKRGDGLTLQQIQEVKRLADRHTSLFTVAWDVKAWATKEWLANLRRDIKRFIEDTAKQNWVSNIRQLNNNTQVSRTLSDAIKRKESADQARELVTMFAPTGIGALWGAATWNNPFEVLRNALIWGTLWGVAWSTTIKTNLASILNRLTPAERQGIINFIDSEWAKPISTAVISKIQDLLSNEE